MEIFAKGMSTSVTVGLLIFIILISGSIGSYQNASDYYKSLGFSGENFEEFFNNFQLPSLQYRLNLTVLPLSYSIRMRPILDDGFPGLERFTAPSEVTIDVESVTNGSSNTIVLHQRNLTIYQDRVTVTNIQTGQNMSIASQTFQPDKDFYIIELGESFQLGDRLQIYIPYTVNLSQTENVGIYLGHYIDPATNETRYLSVTKLEPYHARKVFVLFDEPSLKATFKITIGRLDGKYHSLSNMEITQIEPDQEHKGWVWDHYEETVLMSPYLVCMIVSDFANTTVQIDNGNRAVSAWAPKHDIDQNGGLFGAVAGARILQYFESRFKMDYALRKLDAIGLPQFASGAMENFGLVTYRYAYLVWIPGENTEAERRKISQVLAHEIAHSHFGNVVTSAWWSDIWLSEGFARYLQFWGMKDAVPEFDIDDSIVTDTTQLAMVFDQGPLTHPVKNTAESPEESAAVFDRISYEKAASLLRMMEGFLTRPIFEAGIIDVYLQRMKWKSAFQDDLFQSIQDAVEMHSATQLLPAGTSVKDIMSEWTLTSGYPLVRVDTINQQSIAISQERFMLNSKEAQEEGSWWIPVKVVSAERPSSWDDKLPDVWLPNNVSSIIFSNADLDTTKWLMINPDATGYYRVLYDPKLTELMGQQLLANHTVISSASRSQLFDDYFNLASAEYISIETALGMTTYIERESSSNVWTTVLTHLKPILNKFTQNSAAVAAYKNYFLPRLEGTLSIIGVRQPEIERGINVTLRAQLLDMACQLGMPACLEYSNELVTEWQAHPENNPILPDIRASIYCTVVAESLDDETVWNFMLERFHEATKDRKDTAQTQLLNSLACSKNHTILTRFLELSINDLRQHTSQILTRVAMNPEARSLVYDFVNRSLLEARITPTQFADTISTLSSYWNELGDVTELQQLLNSNEELLESVKSSLDSSLRNIQATVTWWNTCGNRILNWLINNNELLRLYYLAERF